MTKTEVVNTYFKLQVNLDQMLKDLLVDLRKDVSFIIGIKREFYNNLTVDFDNNYHSIILSYKVTQPKVLASLGYKEMIKAKICNIDIENGTLNIPDKIEYLEALNNNLKILCDEAIEFYDQMELLLDKNKKLLFRLFHPKTTDVIDMINTKLKLNEEITELTKVEISYFNDDILKVIYRNFIDNVKSNFGINDIITPRKEIKL